jgi:hypothetical protein
MKESTQAGAPSSDSRSSVTPRLLVGEETPEHPVVDPREVVHPCPIEEISEVRQIPAVRGHRVGRKVPDSHQIVKELVYLLARTQSACCLIAHAVTCRQFLKPLFEYTMLLTNILENVFTATPDLDLTCYQLTLHVNILYYCELMLILVTDFSSVAYTSGTCTPEHPHETARQLPRLDDSCLPMRHFRHTAKEVEAAMTYGLTFGTGEKREFEGNRG